MIVLVFLSTLHIVSIFGHKMQILHLLVSLLPIVLAKGKDEGQKAVYFLHNSNTSDSQVVAMPIQSDGQLGKPVFTSTNGLGGIPISTLSTPAGIFFSASSVTVGGNVRRLRRCLF